MSRIVDLTKELEPLYFVCLEDWSDDMKEAGEHKARWYEKMKEKGLRVKLAVEDDGTVCGMVEYMPIEHSIAQGKDSYFISCLWVHGHKQGVGDRRNWYRVGSNLYSLFRREKYRGLGERNSSCSAGSSTDRMGANKSWRSL